MNLPTEADIDAMTEAQAKAELDRLYNLSPDFVGDIIDITLIVSPLAGPGRLLREVVAVLA